MRRISLYLLVLFIQQASTQAPPVVPLTNAFTAVYCHNSNGPGVMQIRCGLNEKIRMLDAFDASVKNASRLPIQCLKEKQISKESTGVDCKVHTSFTSACSGRENCTVHMQRIRLNSPKDNCHNELVDYTMAFFECISDAFIHDVCSSQAITSPWGTLQTPNFPNPYTSNDDCWCKLSTQLQHRLLLSIIVFQLIPYDQHCAGAGLYLQSSNEQRSTQCTYLQQGHNYLSDSNSLYINFYSRTSTVRGGFWIIYEASHPAAEVHLHCGARDKIGVPTLSSVSLPPPSISTSSDHGWSRLAFNDPPNPTMSLNDHMMYARMTTATPRSSSIDTNFKANTSTIASAFTYPHGALVTYNVAYGPDGWLVKNRLKTSFKPITYIIRTTTHRLPIVTWNFTWHHTQSSTRTSTLRTTKRTTTVTTATTTTTTTTATTTTRKSMTTTSTLVTTRTATPHRRLLFTNRPWIYYGFSNSQSSKRILKVAGTTRSTITTAPITTTTTSAIFSPIKTTLPVPTPWYSPDGLHDWWQRQWYTTKPRKPLIKVNSNAQYTTTTTSAQTTSTTQRTTTTSSTTITTRTTLSSTTVQSTIRLVNKTISTSTTQKSAIVWFRSSTKKPDIFDNSYDDLGILKQTSHLETLAKTNPIISTSTEKQMISMTTKSNWRLVTVNTPPAKRYHQQQYPVVSERNAVGIQADGQMTTFNAHNMIRRVIEQRNKKNAMEYGWLSKTDMTIVAVSILFVILLAIINLVLFAVRRHRHRAHGQHLLSASIPSLLDDRRLGGNGHLHGPIFGDSTNSLMQPGNNNNNDILPAVGEIVIWDEKDQGGYMIDNNGAWAKIEGRQWFGSNLFKNCTKTSLSKSFRSRFRLIRHWDKKNPQNPHQPPMTPKTHPTPQQAFKFPLLMDTATLSPVPEADDYDSSDLSLSDIVIRSSATTLNKSNKCHQKQPLMKSERKYDLSPQSQQQTTKTIQALIHSDQQLSDEYYKRIATSVDDSNYTAMSDNMPREPSIIDQETNRSLGNRINAGEHMIVSVPTMLRPDDDAGTNTDGGDSIYNPHYSVQSIVEYPYPNYLQPSNRTGPFLTQPSISTFKPTTNNPVIIGICQTEFQALDPALLFKTTTDHQQFYRCPQSVPISAYDSGFVDEQTVGSFSITHGHDQSQNDPPNEQKDRRMSMDDMLLTKSEEDDDDNLPLNHSAPTELNKSNRQKWRQASKRVSFQEEHVTQRFSPPLPSSSFNTTTNPETSSDPFDTYDTSTNAPQPIPPAPPLLKTFVAPSTATSFTDNSPTASSIFTTQKQTTSIDNEDTAQNVIMNHLHSVKSLKKFFETKMVGQHAAPAAQSASLTTNDNQRGDRIPTMTKEQKPVDELEQRQEMMNKVLESLKKKKVYTRGMNDTPESTSRYAALTTSSYDSNLAQNLPVQRHYSRRFRSSSTSNNSLHPGGNIITHIQSGNSHYNKRAYSQDRQQYQTADHLNNIDKWKQEHQRQVESDDDDNMSENSMLWQARTKLNEFVTRTRRNQQQSPYYTTCTNGGTPTEDLYTYDDESVTAETRF